MCARITQEFKADDIAELIGLPLSGQTRTAPPCWNGPPGVQYLIVRKDASSREGRLDAVRWGLIPKWRRDDSFAPVNARAETAASKPTFRDAFRDGRGLFPISGWYEWRPERSGKQPYHIRRADGGPILLAAICEPPRPRGRYGETFAVLTTTPRGEIAYIHDRQPAIVDGRDAQEWLEASTTPKRANELASGRGSIELIAHPVSTRVNSTANRGADLTNAIRRAS